MIIDILSRYVPGFCVASVESAEIATALIGAAGPSGGSSAISWRSTPTAVAR